MDYVALLWVEVGQPLSTISRAAHCPGREVCETSCLPYYSSVLLLLTYLVTSWSRVLLEKPSGFQVVKKLPAFYGT